MMGLANPAPAQDRTGLFAQLDVNGDGYVALDEVPAEHQAKFERLLKLAGKDQEQKLNRALFEGAVKADTVKADKSPGEAARPAGDLFGQLDANGDGIVAAEEVNPAQNREFDRLLKNGDIDGDGKLSREEYAASTKETVAPRQPGGRGGSREVRPGGPIGFPPGGPPPSPREMLARLDRDGNGTLNGDEITPSMKENLARIDQDGNGTINEEELGRMLANRRRMAGAGGPPPGSLPVVFALLDTDRNGELSTSEIVAAGSVLLKLDRNDDGKLSPEEVFSAGPGRPPGAPQP
jgi:Ca2+-binding EF-hand superfamily protein